jgi:hypothetical protein
MSKPILAERKPRVSAFSHYSHGYANTEKLYGVWKSMIQRCRDPHITRAKSYVDKGVSVCEEWKDYAVFREWAIASGYSEGLSIDRIDNDGNYEPSNCKWSTNKEQANNRSTNRYITHEGKTLTVSQWAEVIGIARDTLKRRLYCGWSVEKALTTPVRRK